MTYPELLTSLYKEHDLLLSMWKRSVELAGEAGVFTFFPESYISCEDVKDIRFEFWPGSRLETFLRDNGSPDEGYRELATQIDREREFLAYIVEPPEEGGRRPVHIHRIGAVGHN